MVSVTEFETGNDGSNPGQCFLYFGVVFFVCCCSDATLCFGIYFAFHFCLSGTIGLVYGWEKDNTTPYETP